MSSLGALRWALAASSLSASACLVAEPVPYEPPPQTPPVLGLQFALPRVDLPIPVDRDGDVAPDEKTAIEFDVPIRSEDQGENLWYSFHLNFEVSSVRNSLLLKDEIPPSTFEDTSRAIRRTWRVREPMTDGCHRVTLFVAHYRNWLRSEDRPDPDGDPKDVATATWWINVNPAPGERFTLRNCPSDQVVQQ